jgi:hypothetical protein
LVAARVTAAGAVLDRPGVLVPGTDGQHLLSEPALCADASGALLVWGSRRAPGTAADRQTQLRALRIAPGASAADGSGAVLLATADVTTAPVVRMGCNREAALLAFTSNLEPTTGKPPLHLGRVPAGRLALDPPAPAVLEPFEGDEWAGIASDGEEFVVAWRNFDYAGRRMVVGTRVDRAGRVLDAPPFPIGPSNAGHRVSVVWTGSDYLVFAVNTAGGRPFELRGRRVSRQGAGLDRDWTLVAPLAQPWAGTGNGSDVVAVAPGRSFLVYDRYFDEDATGHVRVRGRFVTTLPSPDAGAPPDAADGPVGRDGEARADAPADVSPDTAAAPVTATPALASGCSCRASGARGGPGWGALVLLLAWAGLAVAARKRRATVTAAGARRAPGWWSRARSRRR